MLALMINVIVTFIFNREFILLPKGKLLIYFQLICITLIGIFVRNGVAPKK